MADAQELALDDRGSFDDLVDQRDISADRHLPQETLGADLREARERKGITPEVIWRDLKIAPHHLMAIENSSFDALPGRVYAVGFVRSYARYLGLDVQQCVARLKSELAGPGAEPPTVARISSHCELGTQFHAAPAETVSANERDIGLFSPRERVETSSQPSAQMYVVLGLIVAVLLYAGYNVFSSARLMAPSPVMPVPAQLASEAGISAKKIRAPSLTPDRQGTRVAETFAPTASTNQSPPLAVQSLASIEAIPGSPRDSNRVPSASSAATKSPSDGPQADIEPTPALPPKAKNMPATVSAATKPVSMAPLASIEPTPALSSKAKKIPSTVPAATKPVSMAPLASIEPTPALPSKAKNIPSTVPAATKPASVASLASSEPAPTSPPDPVRTKSTESSPPKQPAPTVGENRSKFRPPLPLGARYGLENGNSRVVLRLHRSIRVAVKGSRNHTFIDRVLGAGATYRVPNIPGVKLSAPDAGAVEVILDGNTVGFAGQEGVAAKGLGLDPPSIIRRYHWQ